jgi:hypothetical protein
VKTVSLAALAALLASSCASGPPVADPQKAAPFVGCYKLTLGPWAPKMDLEGDEGFVAMSEAIRLTDEIGTQGFPRGHFLLRNVPGTAGGRIPPSYWRIEGKNDLVLVWTDGYSSIIAEMTRVKDGLRGRAQTHWDFPREGQERNVSAERMPCPTR